MIGPSASERVMARDAALRHRIAKPRQPFPKAIVSETAGVPPSPAQPPTDDAHTKLAGRSHALGRYEMRWGTARLHEDPNSENAQGPNWDFLVSAR
ncbi:hypothetical protein EKPJFOCH_0259 [Methylobacterium thuringiense]|uniref:Uncharacterized protein n=2 Tax=Methylobacteriaceae TaxID=119045 RepID=A0ABQ4TH18_9HYPH|nr:hypothetical protein EKPJFOCH_0259 [Methylobacterium thuringiense]